MAGNQYTPGDFVDYRDATNRWNVATVVSVENGSLKIRRDGFSEVLYETLQADSEKIAPFRKHTQHYIGPTNIGTRKIDLPLEKIEGLEQELANVEHLDSTQTTQFLRGRLFLFVDALLSHTYSEATDKARAVQFFTKVLSFIAEWLAVVKPLFESPKDSEQAELASAWPELLCTLTRLFGGDMRTSKFFDKPDTIELDVAEAPAIANRGNPVICFHINHFAAEQGFENTLELLKAQAVPFDLLKALPVYSLGKFFTEEFAETWICQFQTLVLARVDNIQEAELKDLDKDSVTTVLRATSDLAQSFVTDQTQECLETCELQLLLKYLRSPYLEKKLRSLNDLREIAEQLHLAYPLPNRWITRARLAQWLLTHQVIELVFESAHIELIKRIPSLLSLLASQEQLNEHVIDALWQCTQNRHESLVNEVYQLILDICPALSVYTQQAFLVKFQQVDEAQYDEKFLGFLKRFVCKLGQSVLGQQVMKFGIEMFYKLTLDSSTNALQSQALEHLQELLKTMSAKDMLWSYFDRTVEHVKQGDSLPQSLRLMCLVLDTIHMHNRAQLLRDSPTRQVHRELAVVVEVLMANTQEYIEQAKKQAQLVADPFIMPLVGKFSHKDNLVTRLRFLDYAKTSVDLSQHPEYIQKLWDWFVLNPVTPQDSDLFFEWVERVCKSSNMLSRHLFHDYFLQRAYFDLAPISPVAYRCFSSLFLSVNVSSKMIAVSNGTLRCRLQEQLIGLSTLFDICLLSRDSEVQSDAKIFLVTLALKAKSLELQIWTRFIQQCLETMQRWDFKPEIVLRVLRLLQQFIDQSPPRRDTELGTTINCSVSYGWEATLRFGMNSNNTIGDLRRVVAQQYSKPVDTLILMIHNFEYDRFDDHLPLQPFRDIVAKAEFTGKPLEFSPKEVLAGHQSTHNQLFRSCLIEDPLIREAAWSILTVLPPHKDLLNRFKMLTEPAETLLQVTSIYQFTYSLAIMQQLASAPSWLRRFNAQNGHNTLINLFLTTEYPNDALYSTYVSKFLVLLDMVLAQATFPFSGNFVTKLLESQIKLATLCRLNDDLEAPEACKSCMSLLKLSCQQTPLHFEKIIKDFPQLNVWLESTLLRAENSYFATTSLTLFLVLISQAPNLGPFILEKLLWLLPQATESGKIGENYWSLLKHLISECDANEEVINATHQMIDALHRTPSEISSAERDTRLCGLLDVLARAIPKAKIDVADDFLQFLMSRCLFDPSAAKCKTADSRTATLKLLEALCTTQQRLELVTEVLSKAHKDMTWRTARFDDWNYTAVPLSRPDSGFIGLRNLGCTCYMNSSLQQLFHTPTFREAILAATDTSEGAMEDNLLIQLQKLFAAMQNSEQEFIDTKDFCHAVKGYDGQPVNVLEQMDVEEFFNSLMDKLESLLKGNAQERTIKNHFGGLQVIECIGQEDCTHVSERYEPFLSLSLPVKNKKDLYESLDTYVQGDLLERENAYQCDACNTKVSALRRVCIKHLPNLLVFGLKRFEFDFDSMRRLKVNDYYEFPHELDMEPYTQEGLEPGRHPILPKSYYKYELRGIVIHIGTADFGHYYSFIKDRTSSRWCEVNDTIVAPFDPAQIPNEAFGGEEKSLINSTYSIREKNKNAYMLFYERSAHYEPRSSNTELTSLDLSTEPGRSFEPSEGNPELVRKIVFSSYYFDFLSFLMSSSTPAMLKFFTEFFLAVLLRSREFNRFTTMTRYITDNLNKFPDLAAWLLELISDPGVVQELLMDCPILEKRKIVLAIVRPALWLVERQWLEPILKRLLNKLAVAKKPASYNYAQYFELVFWIVELRPDLVSLVALNHKLLQHLLNPEVKYAQYAVETVFSENFLGYQSGTELGPLSRDRFMLKEADSSFSYLFSCLSIGRLQMDVFDAALMLKPDVMTRLFRLHLNKTGCRALGELYAYFCRSDQTRSTLYLATLLRGLEQEDYESFTNYFRLLAWAMKAEDGLQPFRVDHALKGFIEVLRSNSRFYFATESCVLFLAKQAMRNPRVKEWMQQRRAEMRSLDKWLKDLLYYSTTTMSGIHPQMFFYKNKIVMHENLAGRVNRGCTFASEQLKLALTKQSSHTDWDSDNEYPKEYLRKGMQLHLTDSTNLTTHKCDVLECLEGVCLVKLEGNDQAKWLDPLTEGLRIDTRLVR